MTKREEIISIAESEIGYSESPAGSNLQKFGEWYGLNGYAWCAMFVSWVYNQAGVPLGHVDDDKGFRYCPSALAFWRKHDKITAFPAIGDIVIYDWQGDGKPDHTGIFRSWVDKGKTFIAIEGNTSSGNDSNGGQVQLRTRKIVQVAAFINPLEIPFP